MKNLLLYLFIILFLSSCGGLSPCDCAQMTVDGISQFFKNPDITPEEMQKLKKDFEKKLAPCTKKSVADSEFQKEFAKCLEEKKRK